MARASSGPGFVGVIVLIVICVALILGYVWLVPAYAKIGDSLDRLHGDIKKNLEDGIKGLGVRAQAVASRSDVAYDQNFFMKVAELANKGVKYESLVEAVGFGGDDSVGQINAELSKATPPQPNLKEYLLALRQDITDLTAKLSATNASLSKVELQRDQAIKLAKEESDRLGEARQQAMNDLASARANFLAEIQKTKELMERAVQNNEKAWAENAQKDEAFQKLEADLQDQIRRLDQKAKELETELFAKKPKPPEITQGRVTQVDLINELAIIDLGEREGVQTDDTFAVMRIGKGGEQIPKAELKVTVVKDIIAHADIVKQSMDDPIIRGDLVVRQMRPEEK